MRRWHALPVAVLVAVATAAGLFSAVTPGAEAGGPTITLEADCDTSTAAVETSCTYAAGTSTLDIDIVLRNNSAGSIDVGAFNFVLRTLQETSFDPVATNNPEIDAGVPAPGSAWACTPPPANPDQNADPNIAESLLSCFESTGTGTVVASGGTLVLATVHYNVLQANAFSSFELDAVSVGNAIGDPLVDCGTEAGFDACIGTSVTVGVAPPTPTPTNTNTPIPATATPCDPNCPPTATGTSLAFRTITPTPGAETATPVPPGGEPTTAPGGGGEQPGGGGQQPGGGTGAGGGRPITLPDTGANGGGGTDWNGMTLVALIALAAGSVAGGTYYYAARRVTGRRDD